MIECPRCPWSNKEQAYACLNPRKRGDRDSAYQSKWCQQFIIPDSGKKEKFQELEMAETEFDFDDKLRLIESLSKRVSFKVPMSVTPEELSHLVEHDITTLSRLLIVRRFQIADEIECKLCESAAAKLGVEV